MMFKRVLRFFSNFVLKFYKCEVLVLGDSHSLVFKNPLFKKRYKHLWFNVKNVGGATISGIENPNSKTKALPIFKKAIKKTSARTCIVLLGEVDIGFVIWHRADKYGSSVEKMFEETINKYKTFLLTLRDFEKVICVSAPLPTIPDNEQLGEVASLRSSISASQLERTKLTLTFNQMMEDFCSTEQIVFLSLDNSSIGKNGLVTNQLLNKDKRDHHYEPLRYAELIAKELSNKNIELV